MQQLILVKHAQPQVDPRWPAREWSLAPDGQRQSRRLAQRLAPFLPARIISSDEIKAIQTAAILAEQLGTTHCVQPDLDEHRRLQAGYLPAVEFQQTLADLFARPAQRVYGSESADEAHARFRAAVLGIMQRNTSGNIIIVTHGTVISLFVSRLSDQDGYTLWRQLGLPSYVVLDLPALAVSSIVLSLAETG